MLKSSTILPKTLCNPSTQEQSVNVKKNCDPIFPLPSLNIDTNPLSSCLNLVGSILKVGP